MSFILALMHPASLLLYCLPPCPVCLGLIVMYRHLTTAAVAHLAALPSLSALHLQETGLSLGHEQLVLLGTGCTGLHTIEAAFDMRSVPLPPWANHIERPMYREGDGVVVSGPFHLSSLRTLLDDRRGTRIRGSGWPRLQKLMLHGVSVSDFEKLIDGCVHLTGLVLNYVGPLHNGGRMLNDLTGCMRQPPPLQEITLSSGMLEASTCFRLGRDLPLLKGIILNNIDILQQGYPAGRVFEGLLQRGAFESLALHQCVWLDDACLTGVLGELNQLRRLEVSQCDKITGPALVTLAGKLPLLSKVLVRECKGVGPADAWEWERLRAAAAAAGVCRTAWAVKQDVVFEP